MNRKSILFCALFATSSLAWAGSSNPNSFALPNSLNIDFSTEPTGTDVTDTGFGTAYYPTPSPDPSNTDPTSASGFFVGPNPNSNFGSSNMLNIWTDPGDIYGRYENDPDSPGPPVNGAENVFYTNFATGSQTIVTAHEVVQNLNQNFHGGGIWLGTDEDHYVRLGVIYNGAHANVEMLRENEDFWAPQTNGQGHSGDGNDIADQQKQTTDAVSDAGTYMDPVDITLQLILTGHTIRAQYSMDNGATWLGVNNIPYFAGVATSPADGATVEGGFKVGAFAFGGGSTTTGEALVSFETFSANTTTLPNVTWQGGSGNASNTSNFANLTTTPNMGNEGRIYEFPDNGAGHTTVTLDSGITGTLDVGGIVFSSPSGYTIAGPQGMLVNGGLIDSQAGDNVISAPLTVSGFARVDSQIHVASGSSLTLAGATLPRLNSLVVDSGGKLDLTTNSVEIDYYTPDVDPFNSILGMIQSGYDNGKWDGSGIVSSAAVGNGTGLAILDTGVTPWPRMNKFGNQAVGSGDPASVSPGSTNRDVLIMYTWLGDTNLDGKVDATDFANMGTGTPGSQTWVNGDFNYDGVVNADDYALLALGDSVQNSVLTPVPEPTAAAMLLALPWIFRRRRAMSQNA